MKYVSTIGLDLAKHVFQVHGADIAGSPLFNRKLRRGEVLRFFEKLPSCLVGMEACGGAHYWAREIANLGHDVRLIPPAYVKPFVKRGKTDAADAEAISEAVIRKTMRFVPIKTAEQQADAMVLKTRALLVQQRTQSVNALRAHLAELGIIAARGLPSVAALMTIVREGEDTRLPAAARFALMAVADQIDTLGDQIFKLERAIVTEAKRDEDMRRLNDDPRRRRHHRCDHKRLWFRIPADSNRRATSPPGWDRHRGPIPAEARNDSAGISKMGNPELRVLLVLGATAVLRIARNDDRARPWLKALLARTLFKVAAVALANKMARIIWALLNKGGIYHRPEPLSIAAVAR